MKQIYLASALMLLAGCSAPPKPPTVNGYHKQPINSQHERTLANRVANPSTPAKQPTEINANQILEKSLHNAKRVEINIHY